VTSVGIRCRITNTIRIQETSVTTAAVIAIRVTVVVVAAMVAETTTGPTIEVIISSGVA
jgi:hypothetical protein